jgi:hypothetical protein
MSMGKAAAFVATMIVLVVGVWVTAERYGRRQIERAIAPLDAPRPPAVTNEAALRLDEIIEPVGVSLLPPAERLREEDSPEARGVRRAADEYLRRELGSSGPAIAPLPPLVEGFLSRHDAAFDALGDALINGEKPQWVSTPDPQSPLPDLRGNLALSRFLAVRALEAQRRGDAGQAWRELEAAAALNRALADRGELVSQLVANAQARIIAGTMRRLDGPVPAWPMKWLTGDFRSPFVQSLMWETSLAAEGRRLTVPEILKQTSGFERAEMLVKLPWHRFESAQFVRTSRTQIEEVRKTNRCFEALNADPAPAGMGILGGPNLADTWKRLNSLLIHLDGTRTVLVAKGSPQSSSPPHCSDATWSVAKTDQGTVVTLTQPLKGENPRVMQLPTRQLLRPGS